MSTTHLLGTGDPAVMATSKPAVAVPTAADLELRQVEILQVIYETSLESTKQVLPPGVHPSIPGHVSWQVWQCRESELGPFSLALNRVGCRLGIKPRCFTTRVVVDNDVVADRLQSGWGYAVTKGSIRVRRGYDRIRGTVDVDDETILDIELSDPLIFNGTAIRYPANLNLARLPHGLRLIQADASYEFERIQRGKAVLHHFDSDAWDSRGLTPTWPMVATMAKVNTKLHEVRYLSDPHLLAAQGTEDIRPKTAETDGKPV